MYRQSILRSLRASAPQPRLFTTNARLQKSATETIKDAAKTVDRTISDTVVKGIEKGGTSISHLGNPSLPHAHSPSHHSPPSLRPLQLNQPNPQALY